MTDHDISDALADRYCDFLDLLTGIDLEQLDAKIDRLVKLRDSLRRMRGAEVPTAGPAPREPRTNALATKQVPPARSGVSVESIAAFLLAHPNSTTRTISKALGGDTDGARVAILLGRNSSRFVPTGTVAPEGGQGKRPRTWAVRTQAAQPQPTEAMS
jgi:hypothetical protein